LRIGEKKTKKKGMAKAKTVAMTANARFLQLDEPPSRAFVENAECSVFPDGKREKKKNDNNKTGIAPESGGRQNKDRGRVSGTLSLVHKW